MCYTVDSISKIITFIEQMAGNKINVNFKEIYIFVFVLYKVHQFQNIVKYGFYIISNNLVLWVLNINVKQDKSVVMVKRCLFTYFIPSSSTVDYSQIRSWQK